MAGILFDMGQAALGGPVSAGQAVASVANTSATNSVSPGSGRVADGAKVFLAKITSRVDDDESDNEKSITLAREVLFADTERDARRYLQVKHRCSFNDYDLSWNRSLTLTEVKPTRVNKDSIDQLIKKREADKVERDRIFKQDRADKLKKEISDSKRKLAAKQAELAKVERQQQ